MLQRRGYRFDMATRAMGMPLDDLDLPRPELELELEPPEWPLYLRTFDLPDGFLAGADTGTLHLRMARAAGEIVAASIAFDLDGDCGIYNVETVEHARGRGLGPRSRCSSCTTPEAAAAAPPACRPRQWPNGCTRGSASATSGGSSSTCRRSSRPSTRRAFPR